MKRLRLFPDCLEPTIVLWLVAFPIFLLSCAGSQNPSVYYSPHQPMMAYLQPDLVDDGVPEPRVHVTVPMNNLIFTQEEGVWSGGLEVSVVAWRNQKQVGGGVAQKEINLPDLTSAGMDSLFTIDVGVPLDFAEEVILEVRARSLGTSRSWNQRLKCQPQQWQQLPLVFTQWSWNIGSEGVLPPQVDALIVEVTTRCLGDIPWPHSPLVAELLIQGVGGFETKQQNTLPNSFEGGAETTIRFELPAESLPFGQYQVWAQLVGASEAGTVIISPWYPARKLINVRVTDFGNQAWMEQLDWLKDLIPQDEQQRLAGLDLPQRSLAWRQLWSDLGPLSSGRLNLQEHLLSILEADQRFAGPQRGASTARGRAWVRYGKPDHLEYKGNQQGHYRRWEIWHYRNRGLVLTFLDAHGLGEFRLIQTEILSDI